MIYWHQPRQLFPHVTCKGFCRIFFFVLHTHTHKNASYQNTFLFMRFLLPARPLTPRLSSSVITQPEIEVWWFWAVFFTGAVKKKKKKGGKKRSKLQQPPLHVSRLYTSRESFTPYWKSKPPPSHRAVIASCFACVASDVARSSCCNQMELTFFCTHTHTHCCFPLYTPKRARS